MNLMGIALYTLRASAFGLFACLAYILWRRASGRNAPWRRALGIFYLAALIQITALRGGIQWAALFGSLRGPVQWTPFKTTLHQLALGAWPFIYHLAGNLLWFVPLGLLARKRAWWRAFLIGAALSAAIEAMQWVFMTGVPDVDDVILNTLGALLGWAIYAIIQKRKSAGL